MSAIERLKQWITAYENHNELGEDLRDASVALDADLATKDAEIARLQERVRELESNQKESSNKILPDSSQLI